MNLHDDAMRRLGQPNVPDPQAEIARLQREVASFRFTVREHIEQFDQLAVKMAQLERDLTAERSKRCGTCADWSNGPFVTRLGQPLEVTGGYCGAERSACHSFTTLWPADHGCPQWREKDKQ